MKSHIVMGRIDIDGDEPWVAMAFKSSDDARVCVEKARALAGRVFAAKSYKNRPTLLFREKDTRGEREILDLIAHDPQAMTDDLAPTVYASVEVELL